MHTHLTTHYPDAHSLRGVLALLDEDQSEVAEEVLVLYRWVAVHLKPRFLLSKHSLYLVVCISM